MNNLKIFGLNATKPFASKVADFLDVPLSPHKECYFDDKEPYVRSEVNIRGNDVYIIQSLFSDENETVCQKFTKLLFFIGSLYDASAHRITVVIPYMGYSRQDRKTESRAPITTKYVAQLLEAVGTNRIMTMDIHNLSAYQNAFRTCKSDELSAKNLHADYICSLGLDNLAVLSPDSGGMGRAERFRNALVRRSKQKIELVYLDKTHKGRNISGTNIIGDVKGKDVIGIDDMISGGSTFRESQAAVDAHGGHLWGVCATHGLFVGAVNENLAQINHVIVTDTINNCSGLNAQLLERITVLSTAEMFARAIRRIHMGESISDLLK